MSFRWFFLFVLLPKEANTSFARELNALRTVDQDDLKINKDLKTSVRAIVYRMFNSKSVRICSIK